MEERPHRPVGVAIIALFLLTDTLLSMLEIFVELPLYERSTTVRQAEGVVLGVLIALGLVRIVAAVGLWLGSRRAWILSMLLVGVGLLLGLASWWNGEPNLLRLFVNTVIAFYLNQRAVRDYFDRHRLAAASARPSA